MSLLGSFAPHMEEYFVGLMMETIDIPVSVIVKAYNEAGGVKYVMLILAQS